MVAKTDRDRPVKNEKGTRQSSEKPAAAPDQPRERTQDMEYTNGNANGDDVQRDVELIPGESQSAKRRSRKGQNRAQWEGKAGSVPEEPPKRPERVFLTIKQVSRITGLCPSSIYAMLHRGELPLPRVLGDRRRRWDSDDVYDWMDSRPKGRGDLGKWIDPAQGN